MKMRYKKFKLNYLAKPNSLKCTCCGNYYNAWWTKCQASHCACYFFKNDNIWYIYGSYPSSFDNTKFVVLNNDTVQARHQLAFDNREKTKNQYGYYDNSKLVICDTCIKKFLNKNYIQEDTNYNPYAAIEELNLFYQENPEKYFEFIRQGPTQCIRLIREYNTQK